MISTTDLDDKIRDLLLQLDQATPPPPSFDELGRHPHTDRPRVATMAAAAAIVVLGVAGIVAVGGRDQGPATQQASSSTPETVTAPTTTTVPGDTVSSAVVNTTPSCAITGAQAVVPNVAGMPWGDAAAVLTTAGLQSNPLPELPAPFETPDTDYVIIRQATAPGTITPCGTAIDITVAYRPGTLYIVQEGDTYESIANSQGITPEQLLGFNGLSVAELEAAGQSSTAPLALGQALRLSKCPTSGACSGPSTDLATLNTGPPSTDPATLNTVPTTTTA